jgi:hypothetical protein
MAVPGMGEILTTVIGRDDVPGGPRDAAQRGSRAGRVGPNVLLHQAPHGLDGIEVMRVTAATV